MEIVEEYLPLVIGVGIAVVLGIGLALALKTESGRQALAGGAVKFALVALGFAEQWLGKMMTSSSADGRLSDIRQARTLLRHDGS
jgi:hypothetical protein